MAKWLALLLVLFVGSAIFAAEPTDEPISDDGPWGSVSGRVIFEGDLKDPRVKKYQNDIEINPPARIFRDQNADRKVVQSSIATVPNEMLLIDPKTRGVKNVFVYLKTKPERVYPWPDDKNLKSVESTFRDYRFVPRSLIVRVGQTVRLTSPAPGSMTNFNVKPMRNPAINPLITPDEPVEWTPRTPERIPFVVDSNVDRAAASYWLVVDHPYAAITKADGSFQLRISPLEITSYASGKKRLATWKRRYFPSPFEPAR